MAKALDANALITRALESEDDGRVLSTMLNGMNGKFAVVNEGAVCSMT
jgi:hypothetical protein